MIVIADTSPVNYLILITCSLEGLAQPDDISSAIAFPASADARSVSEKRFSHPPICGAKREGMSLQRWATALETLRFSTIRSTKIIRNRGARYALRAAPDAPGAR